MATKYSFENKSAVTNNVCHKCNKSIEGQVLSALGKTYHPEHFTCAKCGEPIKSAKFQQHDGEPYCEEDYAKLFLSRCHVCKQPIKDKVIKALGVDWHEEHFVCTHCKKPLAGSSFMEKDGLPYCSTDFYEKFADRCAECGQPITEQAIVALERKWHQHCFKCAKCHNPVIDDHFTVSNGGPICAKCS